MKGYIHIYTGNGKGKTTAALGLALRAAGAGLSTFIGQFLKGTEYSELKAVEMLQPFITIEQFGKKSFVHVDRCTVKDRDMALAGLQRMKEVLLSGKYRLIVFDEVNVAAAFGLLTPSEVLEVLSQKPESAEIVLTGRSAPPEFIQTADLVTDMIEIKHYYQKGIQARVGIEK